jgi:hypothetical protein
MLRKKGRRRKVEDFILKAEKLCAGDALGQKSPGFSRSKHLYPATVARNEGT